MEARMMASEWRVGLRDMVEMEIPAGTWPVLAWTLTPGEKVSGAIREAANFFLERNGIEAQFAFVRKLPMGAPEGEIAPEVDGVMLIEAEWAPAGFVVLARGGTQKISGAFKTWTRKGAKGEWL